MHRYKKAISICLATLALLLLLYNCLRSNKAEKSIVLIHSFEKGRKNYDIFNQELRKELEKQHIDAQLHTFYLDCERVDTHEEPGRMRDYLDSIQRINPDIILVNDDQATYTLLACGHPFVKKVPVVFAGVNYPNKKLLQKYPNVTGWHDKQDFVKNIQFIHALFGRLTIRVAYDRTALGQLSFVDVLQQLRPCKDITILKTPDEFYGILKKTETDIRSFQTLLDSTANCPSFQEARHRNDWGMVQFSPFRQLSGANLLTSLSGLEYSTIYLDTKYDFTSEAMATLVSYPSLSAHNEPVQYFPSSQSRFIGGYMTTLEIQAREQAQTAAEILKGKSPDLIPVRESAKEYILIWEPIKAWGLAYDKIPSYVRVIGISLFERHKTAFNFAIVIAFILIVVIASLLGKMYTREEKQKKRAQEDLVNKNKMLEIALEKAKESDRMKSAFLANMSHEIRTPLNAIVGFSNILQTDTELDGEERLQFLELINTNSDLLLNLINDILDLSRIDSGRMAFSLADHNMNELIHHVYETFLMMMPPEVELLTECPDSPVMIHTDKHRLLQVITNFMNNAVKFTSRGYIKVGYTFDAEHQLLHIFVEDTGIGIAKEKQIAIFERFTKLDEFAQGTGLGLAICRVITEHFSGEITIDSEVGRGSRFTVILPLKPSDA